MNRTLIAALACRVQGSRLYGKPLQSLEPGYTLLDHILRCIAETPEITGSVLGISEGIENLAIADVAKKHGAGYILGDQKDVLWRLIQCGRAGKATDVFRVTTECPFTLWEMVGEAWELHVADGNEITVVDGLPEGAHFEIYSLEALERCHRVGTDADRSEYVSNYASRNPDKFKLGILLPEPALRRLDLRITVDNPEDLVLCRRVYEALKSQGPRIPMRAIVDFLDAAPELRALVAPYVVPKPIWYRGAL